MIYSLSYRGIHISSDDRISFGDGGHEGIVTTAGGTLSLDPADGIDQELAEVVAVLGPNTPGVQYLVVQTETHPEQPPGSFVEVHVHRADARQAFGAMELAGWIVRREAVVVVLIQRDSP